MNKEQILQGLNNLTEHEVTMFSDIFSCINCIQTITRKNEYQLNKDSEQFLSLKNIVTLSLIDTHFDVLYGIEDNSDKLEEVYVQYYNLWNLVSYLNTIEFDYSIPDNDNLYFLISHLISDIMGEDTKSLKVDNISVSEWKEFIKLAHVKIGGMEFTNMPDEDKLLQLLDKR